MKLRQTTMVLLYVKKLYDIQAVLSRRRMRYCDVVEKSDHELDGFIDFGGC